MRPAGDPAGARRGRAHGRAAAGLSVALLVLCAANVPAPADFAAVVDRLLNQQRSGDAAAQLAADRDLSRLPPEALPDVLAVLFHEHPPGTATGAPVLGREQEQLLCELLRRWPDGHVRDALAARGQGDLAATLRALELIGRTSGARGVATVLALAAALDPVHQAHPRVADAVAVSIRSLLARDPGASRDLVNALPETSRALLPAMAAALGGHGRWIALRPLESLFGRDAELDRAVLRALGDWKTWDVAAPACANAVADHLDARDAEVRSAAVIAAGRLRDWDAVPTFLVLLDDPEPRVARAALEALRGFGGTRLASDAEAWEAWYEAELGWRVDRAAEVLREARGPAPDLALRALRELSRHPWFGRELEGEVAPLLRDASTSRALAACDVLRAFGDHESLLELCAALGDPRPELAAAAAQALTAVTGTDLGPSPGAWRALLDD